MDAKEILIVDDEPDILALLSRLLKKGGHHITACKNVAETKTEVAKHEYDVYLLDIHLPDGSGIDIANYIKLLNKPGAILFMSAYDDVYESIPAHVNAEAIFKKPFRHSDVLRVINNLKNE